MQKSNFGFFRFLIRTSAFIGKEMIEVVRQTPLLLTLILGPFLIMLLFGIGYRNEARPLRALLVMEAGDPLQTQVEEQVSRGAGIIYEGTTSDREAAMQKLGNRSVDVVIVIPPNALGTIQNSEQVVVQFYHNEIDPLQVNFVKIFGDVNIDAVNSQIVRTYAEQGQENASTMEQKLAEIRSRIQTTRQMLQAGDALAAQGEQQKLTGDIDALSFLVGGSLGLMNGLEGQTAENNPAGSQATGATENQPITEALTRVQQSNQDMGTIQEGQASYDEELAKLDQMDRDLTDLETALEGFQSIEANVLVAPFSSEAVSLNNTDFQPADFFTPAVIVLLLQHLAVTFSALAIVREQRSGSMELFRISPLSSFETLLGKYLSYLIFGTILGAVITATVILVLNVPMLGNWVNYAIVLLTLLFTALGLGFLISLLAKTEMQAVQYAMLLLLGSVFFSGFFLDLRNLWEPVRVVSYLLPATYAIQLLQDNMLRGSTLDPLMFVGLLGMGLLLFLVAWNMLYRRLQKEWD
ncbi:MAG TPA: ABC transporter permease [Bellilinea sp.]|nr:ABC transporter permease [Bellilinea sp.]